MAYVYLTLETKRDGAYFVALCRETGTPSYGDSADAAKNNLKRALKAEIQMLEEGQSLGRYIKRTGLQVLPSKLKQTSPRAQTSENVSVSCFPIEVPDAYIPKTRTRVSVGERRTL